MTHTLEALSASAGMLGERRHDVTYALLDVQKSLEDLQIMHLTICCCSAKT